MNDLIPPPSDLDRESKALWNSVQNALKEQSTWADSDIGVLERYVRACEMARKLRLAVGADVVVEGSRGQPRPHPALKLALDAEGKPHQYAEALLLTPLARKRHEVNPHSADDELDEVLG